MASSKICVSCKENKDCSEYTKSSVSKDKLSNKCRSCDHVRTAKWREANREYNKFRASYHYAENRISERARNKKWISENPGLTKARKHRRYARKKNAEGSFTAGEWNKLLYECDYKCLSCGSRDNICADHIRSLVDGGTNYIQNIQPLCLICNSVKRTKFIDYRSDRIKELFNE